MPKSVNIANITSAVCGSLDTLGVMMRHGARHYSFGEALNFIFAALVTGIGMGVLVSVVASLLVNSATWLSNYRNVMDDNLPELSLFTGSVVPLFWLVSAAFVLWGIRRLSGITRWHGPADSIYGAHRLDDEVDVRAGMASTLAAFVSMGSGAPVGQYGPLVHFGATIGCFLRKIFGSKVIGVDVFIGCGVAAAIAAGFHAPIAGIVFAHEAILRHFSFRALAPIAIASITSAWFSEKVFGGTPVFILDVVVPDLLPMVPILLISGLVFGLVAILFMLALFQSAKIAGKSGFKPLQLMLISALICGVIAIFVPEVIGVGTVEIRNIIDGMYLLEFLFLIFFLKLFATSLCIGFGLFGGIFSPAVFIGAAAGGFMSKLLAVVGYTTAPHLLPVAGFAAVTAAVVGAPISVVLIVLELTQSYEFAVAAMLAAVVASFLTSLVFGHSFFDEQLFRRGIDLSQGRGNLELMSKSISTICSDAFVVVPNSAKVKKSILLLSKAGVSEGYCLKPDGVLLGKCALPALNLASPGAVLSDHIDHDPMKLNHDASILQAMEVASNFIGETIPVVDQVSGVMVGVVSEADIFNAYLDLQARVHNLEHS